MSTLEMDQRPRTDLATIAGVAPDTVGRWFRDENTAPNPSALQKIAEWFSDGKSKGAKDYIASVFTAVHNDRMSGHQFEQIVNKLAESYRQTTAPAPEAPSAELGASTEPLDERPGESPAELRISLHRVLGDELVGREALARLTANLAHWGNLRADFLAVADQFPFNLVLWLESASQQDLLDLAHRIVADWNARNQKDNAPAGWVCYCGSITDNLPSGFCSSCGHGPDCHESNPVAEALLRRARKYLVFAGLNPLVASIYAGTRSSYRGGEVGGLLATNLAGRGRTDQGQSG